MEKTLLCSFELKNVMGAAENIRAGMDDSQLNTLHILAAMMKDGRNTAHYILVANGLMLEDKGERQGLRTVWRRLRKEAGGKPLEPEDTVRAVEIKAQQLTTGMDSHIMNSLAVVLAICRFRKSAAYQLLEILGVSVAKVRADASKKLAEMVEKEKQGRGEGGQFPPERIGTPVTDRAEGEEDEVKAPVPEPVRPPARPPELQRQPSSPAVASQREAGPPPRPEDLVPVESAEPSDMEISEYEFPLLAAMTRNLVLEASRGGIDPVIGRRREIDQMIQILLKRRSNNPCLIGEPGVGKTALVEGLALELVARTPRTKALHGKLILGLETSSLVAGTSLRGAFSERMQALRKEVRKAGGRFIIFIDEIHTIVGAGAGESSLDAANELKAALARGEFPCIGATTLKEYKKHIESDTALERRFQPVVVEEPSLDEAAEIIRGILGFYEEHHGVTYSPAAVEHAVKLSARYVHDRRLPDKAIDLLDRAGSRCGMAGGTVVDEATVASVLSDKIGVPLEKLLLGTSARYKALLEHLQSAVIGHEAGLKKTADALKRGLAGFSGMRPMASLLFAGPPGVGKKRTAGALASFLFDSADAIRVFDGSEYTESHSVAKLIGTAPGYVGHEEGGQLVEALYRKPFQVLLFNSFDRAHSEVQELLCRVMRTGQLQDGKGRLVHFSNTVIVVTVDIDPKAFEKAGAKNMGFAPATSAVSGQKLAQTAMESLLTGLPANFRNSVDEAVIFQPLSQEEVMSVAEMMVQESTCRLLEEQDISVTLSRDALARIVKLGGYSTEQGARPMHSLLTAELENPLAELILDGDVSRGDRVTVTVGHEGLQFHSRKPAGRAER